MTRNEWLCVVHAYWLRQRDADKQDLDMLLFALAQETLLHAGWLYIDDEQQVQPVRMTKSGLPEGVA